MNVSGVSWGAGLYAAASSRGARTAATADRAGNSGSQTDTTKSTNTQGLTPEEQVQVDKLKARDRVVRQHELAHMAAGAGLITSGASFTYQRGPDGVNYAIGGEVGISTSPGRTPEETLRIAEQIQAAALAPADPSGQDRAVAAEAAQMAQQARLEQAQAERQAAQASDSGTRADSLARTYGLGATASAGLSVYA